MPDLPISPASPPIFPGQALLQFLYGGTGNNSQGGIQDIVSAHSPMQALGSLFGNLNFQQPQASRSGPASPMGAGNGIDATGYQSGFGGAVNAGSPMQSLGALFGFGA